MPVALLSLWLLSGSALIAIKIGVSHAPPLLFAGSRLAVAGVLLLAWSFWRSGWRLDLRPRDVAAAGVAGLGLYAVAQGSVSWASQYMQPGVLAVLITLVPLWVALISWLVLRQPVPLLALAGIVVAFGGVVFLASPAGGARPPLGPVLLTVAGSLAWAAASVYSSRTAISRRPVVATGIQLAIGGGVQLLAGVALGEVGQLHGGAMELAVGPVWIFLVLGPSLVGFPLYTWLLATTPPALANTQAYVGPLVALALAWLLLGSTITLPTLGAVVVILASVALIVSSSGRPRRRPVIADVLEVTEAKAA